MWSPDSQSITVIGRSTTGDPINNTLLINSIVSGHQAVVVPSATPLVLSCTFWTPNSQQLVFITRNHASFVDRQTCAVRLQHSCLPEQWWVHCAMCSRAGLVVAAQLGDQRGVFSICSLVGVPKRIHVLWQISTSRVAFGLSLSPDGLLLAWADYGKLLQSNSIHRARIWGPGQRTGADM